MLAPIGRWVGSPQPGRRTHRPIGWRPFGVAQTHRPIGWRPFGVAQTHRPVGARSLNVAHWAMPASTYRALTRPEPIGRRVGRPPRVPRTGPQTGFGRQKGPRTHRPIGSKTSRGAMPPQADGCNTRRRKGRHVCCLSGMRVQRALEPRPAGPFRYRMDYERYAVADETKQAPGVGCGVTSETAVRAREQSPRRSPT